MIKAIKHKNFIFGYVIRYKKKKGVNFLTPPSLTHQVGSLRHKKNHIILPHLHLKNKRKIIKASNLTIFENITFYLVKKH